MHEYFFEVRGNELDSFNHVNNAVYLNYFEAARWKFFQEKGWLDYLRSRGLHLVVIEANIRYIGELRIFDQCVVKSGFKCEGEYVVADQTIYKAETSKKCAKLAVKMLLVSREERIVYEVPGFIQNELNKAVCV